MAEEGKREIIFCVHCGNNTEMEDEVIDPLIEFTRTIIEYLYVIPQKLTTVQTEINNRGANKY